MRQPSPLRLAAALLLLSLPASTQPSRADKVAADTLFDEAKTLVKQGKYAEACPKFEESQKLDPGVGTLLHLADCYEKTGKLASAWTTFREASNAARNAGQADREGLASKLALALEPKLSKLALFVPPKHDLSDLVITRNGTPVSRALWGTPLPVDPGPQIIEASAPSKKTWVHKLSISATGLTTIEVPQLEPLPTAPPPSASTSAPPPATSAPPPPPPPTATTIQPESSRRTVALVVGGLGVVSLGVGAFLGARTFSLWDQAKSGCPGGKCNDDSSYDAASKARTYGNVSTALFALGAVGAGAGAYLWLTSPDGKQATGLSPILSPQLAGLSVRRSW